ncbi:dipeptidase [Sandaracinobacter sp. RS1-74]|uniref:dipeptidase n=1 Tax=Sandaracinobacteroides sayramensis TaxID=2913411 RepID=UPI001EDAE43C|nr:membrane dipeptidase [Sandaracinobacteroides sayramensis]MCG2842451.1 dipeptidase [Sandaracinobacteroides sayramensis]
MATILREVSSSDAALPIAPLARARDEGGPPPVRPPRFSWTAAFALLLLATGKAYGAPDPALSPAKVAEVHAAAQPFDPHIDIPPSLGLSALPPAESQFSLDLARRGGLRTAGLAIFAAQGPDTAEERQKAEAEALAREAAIDRLVASGGARLARSAGDVRAINAGRELAVVKTIVNGGAFATTPGEIAAWQQRGVRIFGLVHAGHNALADSSRPSLPRGEAPERWGGLSPAGKAAIAELNRLGVVVDVSQLSSKAFAQAVAASGAPVLASHSSARALVDVGRNLGDAELDLLKANGGVVAINAFSAYLRPDGASTTRKIAELQRSFGLNAAGGPVLSAERQAEYTRAYYAIRGEEPKATLAQLIDHVDHAVRRIGIDHVALSSDFNHGGGVIGWADVSQAPAVTAELLKRGYSAADIRKLWSENLLRVLADAERRAAVARP